MKKGYFFLLDGIFALIILVIGYLVISQARAMYTPEIPLYMVSENTMDLLSSIKINELCTGCSCTNQELQQQCSSILNREQTLLDYLGELYHTNKRSSAGQLFNSLTKDFIRQGVFNVEFRIDNNLIYSNLNPQPGKQEADTLISSKKVIFGFYQTPAGQVTFWGPYIAEVNVW